MKKYQGVGTAMVTFFNGGKDLDLSSFKKFVEFQYQNQIDYFVIAGTTGEGVTLSNEEILSLVKTAYSITNGEKAIIIGIGSNNTYQVLERINFFNSYDEISGYLIVTPFYNKPNQEGLFKHYSLIAEASKKDIIVYNVPSRTGGKILPSTLLSLAKKYSNIVAIKEASGSVQFAIETLTTIKSHLDRDFTFISGDDFLTPALISLGYDGVISVVSNQFPYVFRNMVWDFIKGVGKKALSNFYNLVPIMHANFMEVNPVPVKTSLHVMGFGDGSFRPPLAPMSEDNKQKYLKIFNTVYITQQNMESNL